jgi:hypothetical protein
LCCRREELAGELGLDVDSSNQVRGETTAAMASSALGRLQEEIEAAHQAYGQGKFKIKAAGEWL